MVKKPYNSDTGLILTSPDGEIPERSKGADCKSAGLAFTGSNPVLATSFRTRLQLAQPDVKTKNN
jgi:hypothetical protein